MTKLKKGDGITMGEPSTTCQNFSIIELLEFEKNVKCPDLKKKCDKVFEWELLKDKRTFARDSFIKIISSKIISSIVIYLFFQSPIKLLFTFIKSFF